MSTQLANRQDSWEEPEVVFAALRMWLLNVLQWLGQKVSWGWEG